MKSLTTYLLVNLAISTTDSAILANRKEDAKILTKGQVYAGKLGESVKLECQVSNLGVNILLWKQGPRVLTAGTMKVRRDPRVQLMGTDLVLSNLQLEDRGEFDCEVESDREVPVSIRHTLDILYPPRIQPDPLSGELVVKEGSSVTLTCSVSGNPRPTVTWTRNNEALEIGTSLTVYNINRFSAGAYTCTADNSIGPPVSAVITMDVLFPPVVETDRPQVLGGVGRRVELSCRVLAQPEPEVKWFKNANQPVIADPGVRFFQSNTTHHSLILNRMTEVNFGDYVCQATNSLGVGKTHITISGRPEQPVVSSRVQKVGAGAYTVFWRVRTFRPITEHTVYYRIYKKDKEDGWTMVTIQTSRQTSLDDDEVVNDKFTLVSLLENLQYEVQVESRNFFGTSRLSDPIKFHTHKRDPLVEESDLENLLAFRSSAFGLWRRFRLAILCLGLILNYLMS